MLSLIFFNFFVGLFMIRLSARKKEITDSRGREVAPPFAVPLEFLSKFLSLSSPFS
jgi:hypothetical protein